jgi:hypothetical protein
VSELNVNLFDLRKGGYLKFRNTEKEARSREKKQAAKERLERIRMEHAQAFSVGLFGEVNAAHRAQAVESAKCQRKWKLSW